MCKTTVRFWADGTWCYDDEYSEQEYNWKSDDFGVIDLPDTYNECDIQAHIDELIN